MTVDIKKERSKIDLIDHQIVQALRKRFELISAISDIKKKTDKQPIDPKREHKQLKKMLLEYKNNNTNNPNYPFKLFYSIFRQIISSSILNHNSDLVIVCENKLNNYQQLKLLLQYFGFEAKITFKNDKEILELNNTKNTILVLDKNSMLWSDNKINSCFQVFIELPLLETNSNNSILLAKTQFENIESFEEVLVLEKYKNNTLGKVVNVRSENISATNNFTIIGGTASKLIN